MGDDRLAMIKGIEQGHILPFRQLRHVYGKKNRKGSLGYLLHAITPTFDFGEGGGKTVSLAPPSKVMSGQATEREKKAERPGKERKGGVRRGKEEQNEEIKHLGDSLNWATVV